MSEATEIHEGRESTIGPMQNPAYLVEYTNMSQVIEIDGEYVQWPEAWGAIPRLLMRKINACDIEYGRVLISGTITATVPRSPAPRERAMHREKAAK